MTAKRLCQRTFRGFRPLSYLMQQETFKPLYVSADVQTSLNTLDDRVKAQEENPDNSSTSSSAPQPTPLNTSHRRAKKFRDPEVKFLNRRSHNKFHKCQTTCPLDVHPCYCGSQGLFANGKNVVITGGSFYVINKSRPESGGKLVYPWHPLNSSTYFFLGFHGWNKLV